MLQKQFGQALLIRDADDQYRRASTEEIIDAALAELKRRFARGQALTSPVDTKRFLQLKLGHLEHEVFAVLWLDNRHRVLAFEELFRGPSTGPACIRARSSNQPSNTTQRLVSSRTTIRPALLSPARPISALLSGCKRL